MLTEDEKLEIRSKAGMDGLHDALVERDWNHLNDREFFNLLQQYKEIEEKLRNYIYG